MRIFSYRNKQYAKRVLLFLAAILLVAVLFCLIRFIYLQRYLVYVDGQVQLDYRQNLQVQNIQPEQPDDNAYPVEYVTDDESVAVSGVEQTMQKLSGFYLDTGMLQDMGAVSDALEQQDSPQTLLFDMKSIFGNFYYASSIPGANQSSADIAAIGNLLASLSEQDDLYLVARIPSFSDNNFALANQSCGLPLSSGALWMDSKGCYWLDPLDADVQEYLVSIAMELAELGFDEVVFDQFVMPDSSNIVYNSELTRDQVAEQAAKEIRTALSQTPIRVSFSSTAAGVAESADRMYLTVDTGSAVAGLVEGLGDALEDPSAQIVFLTASRDTRFEGYGVLRPLIESEE